MTLAPWNVLASGKFLFDAEEENERELQTQDGPGLVVQPVKIGVNGKKVSRALEKVTEVGTKKFT